ncbi:MAG: 4-hydroxy-tetrahydrodipicolinate synthase [Acidimicrobiia bacterium]|nr:4-hydroxy-tetrahydrodipicolinate synthase [Acidimicrobiia bacterium]
MTDAPFGRLLTAVITPFDDANRVDYGVFYRLCRHLLDTGSDGVVVTGTTGESPTLSTAEKVALYKTAVEAVGDQGLVIAGTGTYNTAESIELSRRAVDVGVNAVMAVTPYYSKPPQEGLYRHFTAIADAAGVPVMLYNIPGRTARVIEIDTLVRLAEHDGIVAVKDAVDDIEFSRKAIPALPDGFAVYSGSDSMTMSIVEAGGVGVVSVTAHLAGRTIKAMLDAAARDDWDEARRLDELIAPLNAALFAEPNPMPLKGALSRVWEPVGSPRLPLVPAVDATVETAVEALEAIG